MASQHRMVNWRQQQGAKLAYYQNFHDEIACTPQTEYIKLIQANMWPFASYRKIINKN